jgi:hypothetical protein
MIRTTCGDPPDANEFLLMAAFGSIVGRRLILGPRADRQPAARA